MFIGCIVFSSWLGLACIVLFLIFTVHSYVAPTLNKLIVLFIYLFIYLFIISATIEGDVVDIIYAEELEIHTALTYHCATYNVWPGPLLIAL